MPGPILPPTMSLIVRADPGDTIQSIADQFGTTAAEVRALNPGLSTVTPGAELAVPTKTVQARPDEGDTWESVAEQFATTVDALHEANPDTTDLTTDTVLNIP